MLTDMDVIATIAVKDLAVSRKFYEEKLGLEVDDAMEGVVTYKSGDHKLFVYQSEYAGGYSATVATWVVYAEIGDIVAELKERGVVFEHYDLPGMTRAGDLHTDQSGFKAAWFKDPDGNILALVTG